MVVFLPPSAANKQTRLHFNKPCIRRPRSTKSTKINPHPHANEGKDNISHFQYKNTLDGGALRVHFVCGTRYNFTLDSAGRGRPLGWPGDM
jgi:hypothetical protein